LITKIPHKPYGYLKIESKAFHALDGQIRLVYEFFLGLFHILG
jgi:hypothetical protein